MIPCPTCVETATSAFCRECGKGVCENCMDRREGVPYCPECAAIIEIAPEREAAVRESPVAPPRALPPVPAAADAPHPFLAGLLGFVPGLGAVYNGQYVKGVLHAAIFGLLIAISTSSPVELRAMLIPLTVFFVLYMPIEAVRTAQAVRRGEQVDEMSGIVGAVLAARGDSPVPGILIIAFGVFFLLLTLEIIRLDMDDVLRAWPVLLIGFGVWRLYASIQARDVPTRRTPEAHSLDIQE